MWSLSSQAAWGRSQGGSGRRPPGAVLRAGRERPRGGRRGPGFVLDRGAIAEHGTHARAPAAAPSPCTPGARGAHPTSPAPSASLIRRSWRSSRAGVPVGSAAAGAGAGGSSPRWCSCC